MLKLIILYSEKEMSKNNTAKMTAAKKLFNTILGGGVSMYSTFTSIV